MPTRTKIPKYTGNGHRRSKHELRQILTNDSNRNMVAGLLAAGDMTLPVNTTPKTDSKITQERVVIAKRGLYNPLKGLTPEILTWQLDAFRQGYLWQFALTAYLMAERDPIVKSSMCKRVKAPARHGYEIVMIEQTDEAKKHKAAIEYCFANLRTMDAMDQDEVGGYSSAIRQMMRGHAFRYQIHEMVWNPKPNAITLHDEVKQPDGTMKTVDAGTMDGLSVALHAIPLWFAENITGKLRYLRQFGELYGQPMEAGGWMVTCGDFLMQATSVAYAYKNLFALKNWAAMAEMWGDAKVYGRTTQMPGTDSYNAMIAAVEGIGNGTRHVISGTKEEAEILTLESSRAAGAGESVYQAMIDYCDKCIATLWRGGDLSTLSRGGGDAQTGVVGASVQGEESNILETDDCDMLEEVLHENIIRWCIRYQFGEGVDPLVRVVIARPDRKNVKLDLEVDKLLAEGGAKQKLADVAERYDRVVQNPDDDFTSLQREQLQQQAEQAQAQADAQAEQQRQAQEQQAGQEATSLSVQDVGKLGSDPNQESKFVWDAGEFSIDDDQDSSLANTEDATGHEHAAEGSPTGGQFVAKGEGGSGKQPSGNGEKEKPKRVEADEKNIMWSRNAIDDASGGYSGREKEIRASADIHEAQFGDWSDNLDDRERDAVAVYAGGRFSDINDSLRGLTDDGEAKAQAKELDAVFKNAPNTTDAITVFRGGGASLLGKNPEKLVGKTISDKGYVSTSTFAAVANGFAGRGFETRMEKGFRRDVPQDIARFQIDVPKGSKAISVDAALREHSLNQHEVLLPRGSKFRITGVEKQTLKNGAVLWNVKAELISKTSIMRNEAFANSIGMTLVNGDSEGHPFRGNQYSDEASGSVNIPTGTILYRGAPTKETQATKRDFPGVFLSTSEKVAKQYGAVTRYKTGGDMRVIDASNPKGEALARLYLAEQGDQEPEQSDIAEVFGFPTDEWAKFIRERGYEGTIYGKDVFVIKPKYVDALANAVKDLPDAAAIKEYAQAIHGEIAAKIKAKYGDLLDRMQAASKLTNDAEFIAERDKLRPELEAMVNDLPNLMPKKSAGAAVLFRQLTEGFLQGVEDGGKREAALKNAEDLPVSVKAIITDSDGRVLILKDARSQWWDLPGGHLQDGETIYDALKREVQEEVGFEPASAQDGEAAQFNLGEKQTPTSVIFFDCIAPDDATVTLSDEHSGFVWATPEQADELNTGVFKPFIAKEAPLPNGDLPGHEFRGNQYSDRAIAATETATSENTIQSHSDAMRSHHEAARDAMRRHDMKAARFHAGEATKHSEAQKALFDEHMAHHAVEMKELHSRLEEIKNRPDPNADLNQKIEDTKSKTKAVVKETRRMEAELRRQELT